MTCEVDQVAYLRRVKRCTWILLLVVSACHPADEGKVPAGAAADEACCADPVAKSIAVADSSTVKCPYCGHQAMEALPTEVCLIRYTCRNCKHELTPLEGDCCVFCSYGSHKCPSMQDNAIQ